MGVPGGSWKKLEMMWKAVEKQKQSVEAVFISLLYCSIRNSVEMKVE